MTYPKDFSGIYLSHGGGPLPLMGDPDHQELVEHLTVHLDVTDTSSIEAAISVIRDGGGESCRLIMSPGTILEGASSPDTLKPSFMSQCPGAVIQNQ